MVHAKTQVKVKVCGLTRATDAALAVRLGAWALGFIFYPKSPRYIRPEAVATLLAELRQEGLSLPKTVGVFVDATPALIREHLRSSGVDAAQLHGDEELSALIELQDLPLIKAFRLQSEAELPKLLPYAAHAEALLFDAAVPGAYGGTGHKADWGLIEKVRIPKPLILSGGLTPDNIREAIERLRPFALDLSSGVESSPGIKDPEKLYRLFQEVGASHAFSS